MAELPISGTVVVNTNLPTVSWQPLSNCPYTDVLAVFRFQLGPDSAYGLDSQQTELQPHEISQAQRYHRQDDRNRFIYTRRILRILVGRYINQEPRDIEFTLGINKKPELRDATGWHINVSHSGDWIVLAIGKSSVGVDVERINPEFAFQDMLPQSFSQQEQQYIEAYPDSRSAFYDLWTRKEALVKATAKGMDDDFAQVPSLIGSQLVSSNLIGASGHWIVTGFPISEAYPGAVAYRPMAEVARFYTVDWGVLSGS